MVAYVADPETGAPLCEDCGTGGCVVDGSWCEAEWCQCLCRADRAAALDDRPDAALANIARDIEAESRPDLAELTAERFRPPAQAPVSDPASYTAWQRQRMCERKRRHDNQLAARKVVLQIWREGRWASTYRCEFCDGWHITSRAELAA